MWTLRGLFVSICTMMLGLLVCMTSGCTTTAPAAEKVSAAEPKRQFAAEAATPPGRAGEIWGVEKYQGKERPADDAGRPGAGALFGRLPDQTAPVPMPLKHTDVKAEIVGYLATVDVTQQYANPFKTTIE